MQIQNYTVTKENKYIQKKKAPIEQDVCWGCEEMKKKQKILEVLSLNKQILAYILFLSF